MITRITEVNKRAILDILNIEKQCFDQSLAWDIQMLTDEINNTFSIVLAYTNNDNKVVGYVAARVLIDSIEIGSIAVDPIYQAQGIGSLLINALVDFAVNCGAETIALEVCVANYSAVKFYQGCGFETVATRRHFYSSDQWGSRDAYTMQLVVK